jgi:hypothetical protein
MSDPAPNPAPPATNTAAPAPTPTIPEQVDLHDAIIADLRKAYDDLKSRLQDVENHLRGRYGFNPKP